MTDHTVSTRLIRSQTQHNCLYDIQGDQARFTGPLLRALKRQSDNSVLQNTSSLVDPSNSSLSYSAQNPNTVALSLADTTGALAGVQLCHTVWGHASRETFWQHKFQHFSFEQSVFWDTDGLFKMWSGLFFFAEHGGKRILRKVGIFLPHYTVWNPRLYSL